MSTYTAFVWPQAVGSYTTPAMPSTFTTLYATTETWNPFSANTADRTQYWEDTAGTLSSADVQLGLYGLSGMQTNQKVVLETAYAAAVAISVSYTSIGGVTQIFQADPNSVSYLSSTLAGCSKTQTVPTGFYWVAVDNTQVPFTYADVQGLAQVIFNQGALAFDHLQSKKAAVRAATTATDVLAVVW